MAFVVFFVFFLKQNSVLRVLKNSDTKNFKQ